MGRRIGANLIAAGTLCILIVAGCGKSRQAQGQAELDRKLQEMVKNIAEPKEPYKGNLSPEKAAEITHEVSQASMAEFPSSKELPTDPKDLFELNKRIREKSEQIYAKHSTTTGDMMRYISDLSPKDRERYNQRLTELFLAQARQTQGAETEFPKNENRPEAMAKPAAKKK